MTRKKCWILVGIAIFLFAISISYYFFLSKPIEFLTEDELIESVSNHYFLSDPIEIQDVIFFDEAHVFVPFTSMGHYGTSYWIWRNGRWKLEAISTIQNPDIWMLDPDDPSTYYIVWNMDRNTEMTAFDIYLLNDRGYWVSNDVHQYAPRVQSKFTVPFDTKDVSYGVKQLPEDWITYLDSFLKVENSKKPQIMFFDFFEPSGAYFGWVPYDANGEVSFSSVYGSESTGRIHLHYLSIAPMHEME